MKRKGYQKKIYTFIMQIIFLYKKYLFGIIICLLLMSLLFFLQPLIIREITDNGMLVKNMGNILKFSGLLVMTGVIYQILDLWQVTLFSKIHNGITYSLYQQVYWKMDRLSIKYYSENSSAELVHMIECDIGNISSVSDQLTTVSITSALQVLGGLIGLSLLDWKMTMLIIMLIPAKLLLVRYFSSKKNQSYEKLIEKNRKFSAWFGDCINGIREMKLWNLFCVRQTDFEVHQRDIMNSYKENRILDKYKTMSISLLDSLLSAALYVLSGFMIIKGNFTIGSAFAFITYSSYVVNPISFFMDIKYYFAQIMPSAKRFLEFLDLPEEQRSDTRQNIIGKESFVAKTPILEMDEIVFGYEENHLVLKGVNLTVQAGEKIAIIGENGSGKSTLLDLISGFYQPNSGVIKLAGIPQQVLGVENVRKKIAVVSQKSYLFKGTIEENVNLDREASQEELTWACKNSAAIAFVKKMQNGFQQSIGQDGANLSGGEKQKLALARALIKDADILILDEPTSEFDEESNKEVIDFVCKNLAEKTVILVTHRYEELEAIEKVYKLSEGQLKQV